MPKYQLDPDKTYTSQEVFDHVAAHLREQGKPAFRNGTNGKPSKCFYRYRGLACAVGGLIPDDRYNPKMDKGEDGLGAWALLRDFPEVSFLKPHESLLDKLQCAHDNWAMERCDLESRLKTVAEHYDLTYTAPEEARP
jgi:hypothetical protein